MDWNTWGPPLAVLALGAVAGLVMGLRTRGASASADPREVLLARKAQLIEAIRSLELERDKHDPADYASRREALVSEAAEVLRAIEEPVPEPAATGGTGGIGVIWALASAGFIGLAAFVMIQSTSERDDGGMGAGMGGAAASAPATGPMQEAMAALESDPNNLEALNQAVHYAILGRDVETAMRFMDRARAIDESDPEVQTHLAALQLMVGMFDRTDETLDKLLTEHPDFSEALIWKAVALIQRDRFDEARPVLERVLETSESSEDRAAAASILADMARIEAGGGAAAAEGAGEPTTSAGSAPSPEAARVAGTLSLPDGASPPAGARLFVYVRSAAAERGPPLAAIRVDNPGFPLHFALAEGDLIRGGDWPDEVWIKARIPAGGDPMARSPDDWESALIGPIRSGTRDVALSLEPPG